MNGVTDGMEKAKYTYHVAPGPAHREEMSTDVDPWIFKNQLASTSLPRLAFCRPAFMEPMCSSQTAILLGPGPSPTFSCL